MRNVRHVFIGFGLAICVLAMPGCYEELDESPQPQAQGSSSSGNANEGLIGPMQQKGSSALGKAKSSATNVVEQAEAHSQHVADQADEMLNDGVGDVPPQDDDGG